MVRSPTVFLTDDRQANSGGGFPTVAAHAQAQSSPNVSPSALSDAYLPFTCHRIGPSHPFGTGFFNGRSPLDFSFPLFLFQLTLVILIIHLVRFLLRPLRQPRIVAEVIGGIIIGPSLLGKNKKFAAIVFPESSKLEIKNLGVAGFMYFLFVSGVKMDLSVVRSAGKKQIVTALFGVAVPFVATLVLAFAIRGSFDWRMQKVASIGAVTSSLSITAFPVLYPVLKELNLLSSDIGRQALTTAIVSDIIGVHAIVAFEAMKQGEGGGLASLWYIVSTVVIMFVLLVGVRKLMVWIARKTPEGKPVDQLCVVAILTGASLIGFFTDLLGVAVANGPLWLGLAIPDGPPLGAALVERCEAIVMELLLPISFTLVGMYTDVFSMGAVWPSLVPLMALALVGYVTKLLAYSVSALFFKTTLKDSLTLGLIMSLRGQVEFVLLVHWMDKEILEVPGFTLLVLFTTAVTGLVTPLIGFVYDPGRPYIINKRRTIQHHPPETELRMVACIHDQESVTGIINLLDVSNPTPTSPLAVSALRLVELVGRASPLFVDHQKHEAFPEYTRDNAIHHALQSYQESRGPEVVKIHFFTAVTPRRTAYQDICELALTAKATLLILPFHAECLDDHGGASLVRSGVQSVNLSVLTHAPCSVGILMDRGRFRSRVAAGAGAFRLPACRLAVLFLGGADAREALAYADRMAASPEVSLTVVRFLSENYEGDDEKEKKLDDGLVTWFWVKNEGNRLVAYREVVVRNGEETIAAIRGMAAGGGGGEYDLWVAGRKQGINPVLLQGLSSWSENPELGIVGDFLASADFESTGSVLVAQKQVLRAQGLNPDPPSKKGFPWFNKTLF